ncbi:MAG: glycosyltransferase family 2 protein [Bacteroidales bacterium]|nr:glycosyltransferase family 2 protein [Bacteroidales bacterium]
MSVESNPLVSIVLPVYNGEKYLAAAIESVMAQSYHNWELFIIDDGSTDSSPSICDAYAERESRIRVFHQVNGGVNSARAKGVDEASGVYLVFLDADDALTQDALLYWTGCFADNYDLLVTGKKEAVLNGEEYLQSLWKGQVGPELWGKMFKTGLYKELEYAIDRRLVMGEDLLLNSLYALNVNKVRILDHQVYLPTLNNAGSVTKTFKHTLEYEKYYFGVVDRLFLEKCKGNDSFEKIKMLVYKSRLNALKYIMLQGGDVDYKDSWFKETRSFFKGRWKELGPSEKLIFVVRNPSLYRSVMKTYLKKV